MVAWFPFALAGSMHTFWFCLDNASNTRVVSGCKPAAHTFRGVRAAPLRLTAGPVYPYWPPRVLPLATLPDYRPLPSRVAQRALCRLALTAWFSPRLRTGLSGHRCGTPAGLPAPAHPYGSTWFVTVQFLRLYLCCSAAKPRSSGLIIAAFRACYLLPPRPALWINSPALLPLPVRHEPVILTLPRWFRSYSHHAPVRQLRSVRCVRLLYARWFWLHAAPAQQRHNG